MILFILSFSRNNIFSLFFLKTVLKIEDSFQESIDK